MNLHPITDAEALKNPDVYKNPRTLDRIKGAELFQRELKGEVPVIGWIEGPLAEACDLAGVSNMLPSLADLQEAYEILGNERSRPGYLMNMIIPWIGKIYQESSVCYSKS